ncbi:hypothetical protein F8G81_20285 [Arthrobacter sp. CDRTa11]|uniref:DUF3846 domain-containing protein n=1 Tax=Arthrobacter sp. CDRTa11 TaxID=2651199 RepID=UPI002265A659|nr:hypothetical protein [Arthrobacter sp. CDRTa11]UZX04676.1 hypothetical protein F8G81_20285 [Arthrobacter sp. CDRTa11]
MIISCNALVVPARLSHPVHLKPVEIDLPALQRVAAGEVGLITGQTWHVYLDNDGRRTSPNMRAEVLIREAGVDLEDTVHGTAIFLGRRNGGEDTDAPHHLIRLAEELFDVPLAA